MVLSGDKRKFCRCAVTVSTAKVVHALVHFGVEHPTPNTIRSTNQGHSESTATSDTGNDLLDRFAIFVFEKYHLRRGALLKVFIFYCANGLCCYCSR